MVAPAGPDRRFRGWGREAAGRLFRPRPCRVGSVRGPDAPGRFAAAIEAARPQSSKPLRRA
ncbi:hypothetical protein [Lysobacter gummosus]|uniref:hypothetical protein n=1 Tax=Lysobacter gummosus TaxID=262324 RepID=UPI0036252F97